MEYDKNRTSKFVYIQGEFIEYTEIKSSNRSNFDDAVYLGLHPSWWVKVNGIIQDKDLMGFINSKDSNEPSTI